MSPIIPSASEVRAALQPLSASQLQSLASISGVPLFTLMKVKSGETQNPRIDTVRLFLPHLSAVKEAA